MMSPYFSVVVPTRNRPYLVVDTIRSLISQTFSDFEIIISDNSSPEMANETRRQLDAFLSSDRRVRYIRPPVELNMTSHWEWAVQRATGTYVGIITDRMVLRHYALNEISLISHRLSPTSICIGNTVVKEAFSRFALRQLYSTGEPRAVQTRERITQFSRGELYKDCPRMLNSFSRRDVLDRIYGKYGYIFSSISPDYFFCFRILDEVTDYTVIDAPLIVVQGENLSNGRAFNIGKPNEASRYFLKQIMQEQSRWLTFGPIPNDVWVMPNVILREYEAVSNSSLNGKMPVIDTQGFYLNTIDYLRRLNIGESIGIEAISSMISFREANPNLPIEPLDALISEASRGRSSRISRIKAVVKNLMLNKFLNTIMRRGYTYGSSINDLLVADHKCFTRE